MVWGWGNPIAFGLFLLMCGGTVVLLGLGVALAASSGRLARLPRGGRR